MSVGALLGEVPELLRGKTPWLRAWTINWVPARAAVCVAFIVIGAGSFGAAMGLWRAPLQALYCGIKLPVILLLTALGNGLLNGMLAPLLGLNIRIRQSLLAVLVSFTLSALILGACSPLLAYLVWNLPPLDDPAGQRLVSHSTILLTETIIIAFAGIAANVRLVQLLKSIGDGPKAARTVLVAWLLGNLLLGSQLAWVVRPFVGSPNLPVEFLRPDAFQGSFFEALLTAAGHLLKP